MRLRVLTVVLVLCIAGCGGAATQIPLSSGNAPRIDSNPPHATITETSIPADIGGAQGGIAVAPDASVYISVGGYNAGAKYAGGTFTPIPLVYPPDEAYATGPVGTSSTNGAFFAISGNATGSATMQGGVQSYVAGTSTFQLYGAMVTVDAVAGDTSGNIWMSWNNNCGTGTCLAKFANNNPSSVQSVSVGAYPLAIHGIAPDSDGSIWIALSNGTLSHYSSSLTLLGSITLPRGMQADGLVVQGNGTLWWTDTAANAIGKYASGSAVEYPIPTPQSGAGAITVGGDGAVWFTEFKASKIGRIDASGAIAEYATPTPNAGPSGIAGPNGGACSPKVLWFVEASSSKIGKITLQ
jgi:streptogramin lyase